MPKIEKSRFGNITIEMVVKGKGNKGFESEDQELRGGTNLLFYKKAFFLLVSGIKSLIELFVSLNHAYILTFFLCNS